MSRWTYEEPDEGQLIVTCKGPRVTLLVYSDLLSGPHEDAAAAFYLTPEKAIELSEWLAIYAKESKTYRR